MSKPSSSPHEDVHGFDPLAFWIQYRSAIRASIAALLAVMVVYTVSELVAHQRRQAAAEAFALAKNSEQLAAFIKDHAGQPAAGNAALLLSGKQRAEGQIEEALKTLTSFIAENPKHPLLGSAHLAVASILEQQGKQEEAIVAYRRLVSIEPRGMAAPVAFLRMARIYRIQNKNDEAKAMYESLQSQFPTSAFANEALQEGQELSGPATLPSAVPATPVTAPAPTPAPTPAPAPEPAPNK
ncbi:MAG: TolA-binding protein [Verrucomicrobia bacterium]|nr:MAG: TolA-binding protein [Verrucomicrobiota bacterium]